MESGKLLRRAKDYPFDVPQQSFIFVHGEAWRITALDFNRLPQSVIIRGSIRRSLADVVPALQDLSDLHPVLAYGSNGAISRLKEKYRHDQARPIVMLKGQLHDFDATFSAHFTTYGSIPATLQHSLGTVVDLFVMYISEEDLETLHASENVGVNYAFVRLDGIRLNVADATSLKSVHSYISKRGSLDIAMTAVTARNRIFPAMTEVEILTWARDRLEPEKGLDAFITEGLLDQETRSRRTKCLSRLAKPFCYDSVVPVRG